jgi:hypothetical protein
VPSSVPRYPVRIVLTAFVAGLAALARPTAAPAGCNLIPQAQPIFRGALGTLDRPFAGPGDFVELHVRPAICDRTSSGIGTDPSSLVVTLLFTPSAGPKRAVVLTTQSCTDPALVQKLNACASTPGMGVGGVSCVQVNQSGPVDAAIVTRDDSIPRLRFRFPDTDAIVGPAGDDRTLAGPATIAVSHVGDDLPCGLINGTCESQAAGLGLIGCVDQLFARDGTCDPNPDPVFAHFTALPPPTDYETACYAEDPPCTATATETRFTLDADGNLLVPMHWQGILVHDATSAVPRLLRATLKPPVPIALPSGLFVTSLTPQGQRLPPIFEPQLDPTGAAGALTFFGSVDVADTVLRIAHRRGVCASGTSAGHACSVDLDCDGGPCVDACTGGNRDGLACADDGDCGRRGVCGALYDATAFAAFSSNGGPIVLPKQVPPQTGGICQVEPHAACTKNSMCGGTDDLCALYALQAENPVSLDSLTTRTDDLRAFTAAETLDDVDRTGDGDLADVVVTLQDRATGRFQPLGAPRGFAAGGAPLPACGLSGTPQGRAIIQVPSGPFTLPALALEGHVAAFVESEHGEGSCDENGDGDDTDGILRVFTVPGNERTAGVSPPRAVDPSLKINGRSLAVSNGRVFFRTFVAGGDEAAVLEVLDTASGGVTTLCRAEQAAVQDGRVAFLRPESPLPTPPGGCPSGSLNGPGDTDVLDEVVQLWTGSAVQNLGRAARAVALSASHVAAIVDEAAEGTGGGTDLNGDGDRLDGVVQVHPVVGGTWTSTDFAADTITFCGAVLAFITPEASQGAGSGSDLNGDDDHVDRVLQLYVPATGVRINTGQAAEEIVCNDQVVAFRTSEAAQGNSDLEHGSDDNDPPAFVLQAWDLSRSECLTASPPADCLRNSHQAAETCMAEVCDPRTPYKVAGHTVKFLTSECAQRGAVDAAYCGNSGGTDLNGDFPPDAKDQVLQVFDVSGARTTTVGTTGNLTQDPLQGGPDDEGDGTGGTFFVASGRCIETLGGSCTTNANCGAAGFCDGGTCKRDHRTCVTDLDCPPGVPCVTGAGGAIIAASPDKDGDNVPDQLDNCPDVANADHADFDGDQVGDACDRDCTACTTFQCYEVRPEFLAPTTVTEEDRFGTATVKTRYPHRLCAPADTKGEAIADPVPHLVGYETIPTPFTRLRSKTIVNQFGSIVLDLVRRDVLMLPTAVSFGGPPAPLPLPTIDHYQCYRTKRAKGQPRFEKIAVSVKDELEETVNLTLIRAHRLCVPVNADGEDPTAKTRPRLLLCYTSRGPNFGTPEGQIHNQKFGTDGVQLIHRRELCVPSTLP